MKTPTLRASVVILAALTLAACSDAPTSPIAPSVDPSASASPWLSWGGGDTSTVRVTVGPYTSVTMQINTHKLVIPAGAVCDPATSGYGPSYWNSPCSVAPSVTITAKAWKLPNGRPHVEFSPALRFAPGKTVTLYLMDRTMAANASSVILYCDGTACVDESIGDPSLATKRDANAGYVYRRIKHFSGYNIAAD